MKRKGTGADLRKHLRKTDPAMFPKPKTKTGPEAFETDAIDRELLDPLIRQFFAEDQQLQAIQAEYNKTQQAFSKTVASLYRYANGAAKRRGFAGEYFPLTKNKIINKTAAEKYKVPLQFFPDAKQLAAMKAEQNQAEEPKKD